MIQLELAGENALILYLPAEISERNLSQLQQLQLQVRLLLGEQLQELLPSYASLLIVLKPDRQG